MWLTQSTYQAAALMAWIRPPAIGSLVALLQMGSLVKPAMAGLTGVLGRAKERKSCEMIAEAMENIGKTSH